MSAAESISFCSRGSTHQNRFWMLPVEMPCMNTPEALSYMERDMSEGVAEMVFADTSIFSGGYPELTERLAKLLDQPEFLADLNERLLGLAEAYAEDKSVMRMQFYRPDKVSERFQKFALPYQPYQAREGFQWNTQKVFITDDEINAFLAGGGPYSDGRLATYSFFLTHTEKAERAAFLKDRYGVGGSSHALSRADDSHASYDGRGLELARGIYGKPDALVKLKWNQAAERVARLIDQSLYLKPADYSRMPNYEREQMANRVIGFYYHLPDEVERPFERELLNKDARKKLPIMLADPEQAAELLEKMDAALLSVPLDSPEYAEKSKTLAELHQYVEGNVHDLPWKRKRLLRFLFLRQDKYRFSIFGRRNRNRKSIQPSQWLKNLRSRRKSTVEMSGIISIWKMTTFIKSNVLRIL